MPKWKLHNKIAAEMGIPKGLSNKVNSIIDIDGVHDGREIPEVFLKDAIQCYELGGYEGLKAFFLHHILDRLAQKLIGEAYREVWKKPPKSNEYVLDVTLSDANDWLKNLKDFEPINEAKEALGEVTAYIKSNYKEITASIVDEIRGVES